MRSIPCSLMFVFLCSALLQCAPNYEPYKEETQQAGEEKRNNTTPASNKIVQPKATAAEAKRNTEVGTVVNNEEEEMSTEKGAEAVEEDERKADEENELTIVEESAARITGSKTPNLDCSQRRKSQLTTPDRAIRSKARSLLGKSPDSPEIYETPPRTPTREKAEEILKRSKKCLPRK